MVLSVYILSLLRYYISIIDVWHYDMGICCVIQVHLAYGLPAGAVTYIDEEGDKISLDSEGKSTPAHLDRKTFALMPVIWLLLCFCEF